MPFTCNCGYKNLCIKCRLPSEHVCTYNWRKAGMEQIIKENPVIKAKQIDPLQTYNWRKAGMEQIIKENPVIKAKQIDPL